MLRSLRCLQPEREATSLPNLDLGELASLEVTQVATETYSVAVANVVVQRARHVAGDHSHSLMEVVENSVFDVVQEDCSADGHDIDCLSAHAWAGKTAGLRSQLAMVGGPQAKSVVVEDWGSAETVKRVLCLGTNDDCE